MRAWIEIGVLISSSVIVLVALFMRAWIEIKREKGKEKNAKKSPSS